VDKWDLEYLGDNIHSSDNSVYVAKGNRFMYYDDSKNDARFPFQPPTTLVKLTFKEFVKKLKVKSFYWTIELTIKTQEEGDMKYYLQQSLTQEGVGPNIVNDFKSC
jgi:hypothetical protein